MKRTSRHFQSVSQEPHRRAARGLLIGFLLMLLMMTLESFIPSLAPASLARLKLLGLDMLLAIRSPSHAGTPHAPTIVVIEFDEAYMKRDETGNARVNVADVATVLAYLKRRGASVVVVDLDISSEMRGAEHLQNVLSTAAASPSTLPEVIFPRILSARYSGSCAGSGGQAAKAGRSFLGNKEQAYPQVLFGSADLEVDIDGKVRRVCAAIDVANPEAQDARHGQLPALAWLAAYAALKSDPNRVITQPAANATILLPAMSLLNGSGRWIADGAATPRLIEYGADEILVDAGNERIALPSDAIYFIGATHSFSGDFHRVVLSERGSQARPLVPGVIIHAHATREYVRRLSAAPQPLARPAPKWVVDVVIGSAALLAGTLFWYWRFRREQRAEQRGTAWTLASQTASLLLYAAFLLSFGIMTLWISLYLLSDVTREAADVDFAIPFAALLFEGAAKLIKLLEDLLDTLVAALSTLVRRIRSKLHDLHSEARPSAVGADGPDPGRADEPRGGDAKL